MNLLIPLMNKMRNKNAIKLIDKGLGSQKTKGLISRLDLLVAARMHCCVAGISTGTPTLFITYSNKGRGMSLYAYGHHDFEIECCDIYNKPGNLSGLMTSMIKNRVDIKTILNERLNSFSNESMEAGIILSEVIKNS